MTEKQQQTEQTFRETIATFDTGMLVTHDGEHRIHARPMHIAQVDENNDLWFVTEIDAPKVGETLEDPEVAVTLQSSSRYLSVNGTAKVVRNAERIEQLWRPAWLAWFPKGTKDPQLALLHVKTRSASFWDLSGSKGIRYAFDALKKVIKGEKTSQPTNDQHAQVRL